MQSKKEKNMKRRGKEKKVKYCKMLMSLNKIIICKLIASCNFYLTHISWPQLKDSSNLKGDMGRGECVRSSKGYIISCAH